MISEKVAMLLNEQIQKEFFSAYLYLDIATYYSEEGLEGFENWFTIQAQEERDHALLMRTYLMNNDQPVKLLAIPAPQNNFTDFAQPLDVVLEHEKSITASIHHIYGIAQDEKDFRTTQFLDWFVQEQGEEEKNASDLIKKFSLFGKDAKGLYDLDNELGARAYNTPSLVLE